MRKLICLAILACDAFAAADFSQVRQLLQSGNRDAAAAQLDRIVSSQLPPNDLFEVGWLFGQTGRFDTALKLFKTIPTDVPDLVTHQYAIALCEFQLQQYADAAATLSSLSSNADFGPKQANLLGVTYSKLGQPAKAFRAFQSAIDRSPSDPAAYFNIVTLFCEQGKMQECEAAAAQTARAFPDSLEAHVVHGAALLENGHAEAARQEFARAATLNPKSAEAAFFVALTDYRSGRYDAAAAELRTSLASGAEDSDVHYLLAESLLHGSNPDEKAAIRELNRALYEDPNSAPAFAARGKLELTQNQPALATQDLEKALQLDPNSRPAIYTLARLYQVTGKIAQASELRSRLRVQTADSPADVGQARLNAALSGASNK